MKSVCCIVSMLLILVGGCSGPTEVTVTKTVSGGEPLAGGGVPPLRMVGALEEGETRLPPAPENEGVTVAGSFYSVVISEIFYDPVAVPDEVGEWFEISNLGKVPLPLKNLEIVSAAGSVEMGLNASLMPGGIAVVARYEAPTMEPYALVPDVVVPGYMLPNSSGFLELRLDGNTLDRVEYGGSLGYAHEPGSSLSLDNGAYSATLNDLAGNWCVSTTSYAGGAFGTPGKSNPHCATGTEVPGEDAESTEGGAPDTVGGEGGGGNDTVGTGEEGGQGGGEPDTSEPKEDGTTGPSGDSGGGPPNPGPSYKGLLISEILYDPVSTSDEDGEWIEILNTSDFAVDLRGMELLDNAGSHVIEDALPVLVPAGGVALLASSGDVGENGGVYPDYVYLSLTFNNDGDRVALMDGFTIVDEVFYGEEYGFPNVAGASLSLDPVAWDPWDNDDGENWCAAGAGFGLGDGGTPGKLNAACDSEGLVLEPSGPYESLLFTEIMYNPSAVSDVKGEWVEVHNPTDIPVDMRGMTFADEDGSHLIATPEPVWVPAEGYAVLVRDGNQETNGGVKPDHVYAGITLNNDEGELSLSYDGQVVDWVSYGPENGFPSADGASLQFNFGLIQDSFVNDSPGGWCPSKSSFGGGDAGTPGADNSTCP